MKKFIKDNFVIILVIVLPIVFLFFVALVAYVPSLFVSTDYNFLYTCKEELNYQVVDEKLKIEDNDGSIFLYDTTENYSKEISLKEAREKTISSIVSSPDGVNFTGSFQKINGNPFYYRSSSYDYFLEKKGNKKKINLIGCDTFYGKDNIDFIGWILNNKL